MKTILIADDDKHIHTLIEIYLKNEGFFILHAFNGIEALHMIQNEEVHLLILDVMMPEMDGMETCIKLRETKNIPVIFLTAKSEDVDLIQGLTIGADDFITKPFNPLELVARVKSQLRRYLTLQGSEIPTNNDEIRTDELTINIKTHEVKVGDREVHLTRREFAILELLARHRGIVFSMEKIYERVWDKPFLDSENTVMVHIRKLRSKIEENSKKPRYIQTVWGVGYKFKKE